jgi:hypothetical protein
MSVFATFGAYNRNDDWLVILIGLIVCYLILYPLYILYLRYRYVRLIKKQLVTSMYKLPISMSPTELAYIFSSKVKRPQLFATILDLANRSIVIMHKTHDNLTVTNGPKVDNDIKPFEFLLLNKINETEEPTKVNSVIDGFTSYEVKKGVKIEGSKQYVFWWLLRDNLRSRKIIQTHLAKKYLYMLFIFGFVASFIVIEVTIISVRLMQMIGAGEVSTNRLIDSASSGISFWILAVLPILFISFGLLKFKGRMMGREWIMTSRYKRYLSQIDSFREFVRLTHKNRLKFESKELHKESVALTRPYAIACGFIKE